MMFPAHYLYQFHRLNTSLSNGIIFSESNQNTLNFERSYSRRKDNGYLWYSTSTYPGQKDPDFEISLDFYWLDE
jgi:hypothetical protein